MNKITLNKKISVFVPGKRALAIQEIYKACINLSDTDKEALISLAQKYKAEIKNGIYLNILSTESALKEEFSKLTNRLKFKNYISGDVICAALLR